MVRPEHSSHILFEDALLLPQPGFNKVDYEGWRTGRGTYLWPNGDIYEGDFVENERTGRGIYYFFDGAVYEGSFLDNESHGQVTSYFLNGDVYDGDFVKGDRTGQGTLFIESTGDVYTGGFLNGNFNGFGTYRWRSGATHEGNFSNDRPFGTGTRTYVNGDRFIASWTSWLDGIGTYYFVNGVSEPARIINGVWD